MEKERRNAGSSEAPESYATLVFSPRLGCSYWPICLFKNPEWGVSVSERAGAVVTAVLRPTSANVKSSAASAIVASRF